MRFSFIFFMLFILLLLLTTCVSEIDFKPKETAQQLVVDGKLTNTDEVERIKLSYVAAYNARPTPITNAQLQIIDANGTVVPYLNLENGSYQRPSNFVPEIGKSYKVHIVLKNENIYESSSIVMPEPVRADSISYNLGRKAVYDDSGRAISNAILDINVHTSLPINRRVWLRWEAETVWSFTEIPHTVFSIFKTCYYQEPIGADMIPLLDSEKTTTVYIKKKVATEDVGKNYKFQERHYFIVHQLTTTLEASRYWERINVTANPSATIFDPVPASIQGNIKNINDEKEKVFGFFEVAGQSTQRIFTTFGELRQIVPIPQYCESCYYTPACCGCEKLQSDGHLDEKPVWWK